jgi:hypothetical protein
LRDDLTGEVLMDKVKIEDFVKLKAVEVVSMHAANPYQQRLS